MITFSCQKCGKQYSLKPDFAGRKTTCSGCKEPLVVPERESPQTVAPEAKSRIAFSCTRCGMKFNALAEFAGRKTACPSCKESLVVPSPEQTVAYVPPAGQIDGPASSLAQANVDAGVTLGSGAAAGKSFLQGLIDGKSADGARYVIEKELARGGMGAILCAIDCDIRREVAVKYLLDQTSAKNKIRFVEEAQITGQLEHPNIVPIHELGVDAQKRIFFTMKLVKGRSVGQILQLLRDSASPRPAGGEGPGVRVDAVKEYTLNRLLNIFVGVCNALAYAHSRGVVHRDLKPANIMVGDFGEVYVMDWGLAKVLDKGTSMDKSPPMALPVATMAVQQKSRAVPMAAPVETSSGSGTGKVTTSREADADLTQAGAVLGTPVYMPPEQAAGKIDLIDERSDIYSMGAILYEMLTLQPPIDKTGGFWPIILRVSEAQIELPEKKAPERARAGKIPPELAAVAMKALAKEKTDRYQTIEAMHKDIELFQEGRSVSAKQDTFREMFWKLVKRNKGASIATGIALLVLLTVLAVSFQFINAARLRAEVAQNKAEENYQAYAKQVRESAPVLLRTANVALNERQFDDALVQAALAAKSDPDNAEARLLNGKLLITRKRFAEAIPELEEYLKLNRENAFVRKLAELCRTAQAETAESPAETASLLAFAEIFTQAHDHALADGVLSGLGLGKNAVEVRQRMLEMYRKRIDAAWPGKGNLLTISAEGRFSFPGQGAKITDLTPLRGIPLSDLNLDGDDGVWDLAPLKGMPLTSLNLCGCAQVRDLEPLKGMPLTSLNLCGCAQVRDLEPLKGMPLTALYLGWCAQVQDLTPLKGMPLTALNLGGCGQVRDLAPLKGMKLTSLVLWGTQLRDLEPLKGMPLREIHLPPNASKGIEVIRAMKTLQSIDGTPPPQFWKVWDAAKAKEK